MMGSAFVGVIGWSFLGFAGADGIFPSVPGMGAAFIAHFIMNQIRTPELSSLGRYDWPDGKKLGAIGTVIGLTFLAGEVSYLVNAPDSSDSMGGVGDYTIDSTLSVHDFADGTEYVMDGDTLTLVFNTDTIDSWENGDNVVGVRVLMNFGEDETNSGGPLCAGSNNAQDSITGMIIHDEHEQTAQGSNANGQGAAIRDNDGIYFDPLTTPDVRVQNSIKQYLGLFYIQLNMEHQKPLVFQSLEYVVIYNLQYVFF